MHNLLIAVIFGLTMPTGIPSGRGGDPDPCGGDPLFWRVTVLAHHLGNADLVDAYTVATVEDHAEAVAAKDDALENGVEFTPTIGPGEDTPNTSGLAAAAIHTWDIRKVCCPNGPTQTCHPPQQ